MIPVEEKYEFEMPEIVMQKIEQADDRHTLISEGDVADLSAVSIRGRAYCVIKRILDIVIALVALLVALIPMVVIMLAIVIDDPGKPIFKQYRVGQNGKRFKFYKFRTMKMDTPKYLSTSEVEDPEQYITRLGRFLRKSSLDELPQLLNVLRGDMSLIGPRPLISDEFEIHQMRMRFGVYALRPGVTGLAQVNGRDKVSPADKVRWDVKYLENFGFKMDMKILLSTVPKVFGGKDVAEGYDSNKNGEK